MTSAAGLMSSRMLSSISASPGLVASVQRLLGYIDDLPAGATGALHFADQSVTFLESRKICWVATRGVRIRLTDILRNQSTPPVPREQVELIYRTCKENGTPIGEALVASGLAFQAGLRAALFKHNGDWVSGVFDVASTVDSEVFAARANWSGSAGLVTWRLDDVGYLGLCSSRAAAARLVSRLSERASRSSGVVLRGVRNGGESP